VAGRGTTATIALERAKIPFTLHEYKHDPKAESYGMEASEALGIAPERMFKTLIAAVDGKLTVGVVPVHRHLDLKALAAAAGGKKAAMAPVADAERATGYVAGGISPVGQKRLLPIVLDETALALPGTLFCSAGRRGLEIEMAPEDLIKATDATVAAISALFFGTNAGTSLSPRIPGIPGNAVPGSRLFGLRFPGYRFSGYRFSGFRLLGGGGNLVGRAGRLR
jgi:Cys-tRNA(Pro)/Cys-tRNA(Cys) deacylase